MCGMQVVVVDCDDSGNIEVADLAAKAAEHADRLACLMITYPSTHGVFEEAVKDICDIVHRHGGQVYMDGANLNAQVGLTSTGADRCRRVHMNLHKTFCIPHGGGGPGMGPDRPQIPSGSVHGQSLRINRSRPARRPGCGVGGTLGIGVDPADLLDVHRHDGR
jgi:hypothetical protein